MRVDVYPRQAELVPGQPQPITISITNTTTVIAGYVVRVLGADPGWVQLEASDVSLFPDEVRVLTATITPPSTIASGNRRVAVQVRELTPPYDSSITELDLAVPVARAVALRVDPLTVTGGRSGSFSLIAENTGNTVVDGRLAGSDQEGAVRFEFDPEYVRLAPGEHAVIDLQARARRRLVGTPAARILGLHLDDADDSILAVPGAVPPPAAHPDSAPLANATFIQRPVFSRGALSLLGLLASISVFAIVITIALSRLVGQSTADRNLALQVAEARNTGSGTGTSGIAGTVRQLTSRQPEAGVSVSVFSASNTSTPVATTATDRTGAYRFSELPAGGYKLSFRGAGFVQIWYPEAATDADANTVTLAPGQQKTGVDVTIGGVPATISGTVTGDDVSAATLYLETAPPTGPAADAARATPLTESTPVNPLPNDGNAIVQTVPIGSDGSFSLTNVPSPSVYDIVVTKVGYATSTQQIDVGAGENRTGVQIELLKGDGLISGTASSSSGPLGGVTITATTGQQTVSTVSLTDTDVGAFTLRNLPTPGTYTLVARLGGYTTQTETLTLSAGQKLTGVAVTLGRSSGSLRGTVTTTDGRGAGDVAVTVTDGLHTVQTETESTGTVGAWRVGGLPVPGTYTITFERSDLAAQTISLALDSAGQVTPGSQGAHVDAQGRVLVSMQSATAVVFGTVEQCTSGAPPACPAAAVGEATVTLESGSNSYTVTSASVPDRGAYRVANLPPGTYTMTVAVGSGTTPSSIEFTLRAGDVVRRNVVLALPASIGGTVEQGCPASGTDCSPNPLSGWFVFLYAASDYPGKLSQPAQVTGPAGGFTFANVDAGDYIVAVGPTSDPGGAVASRRVTVQPSKRTKVSIVVPS